MKSVEKEKFILTTLDIKKIRGEVQQEEITEKEKQQDEKERKLKKLLHRTARELLQELGIEVEEPLRLRDHYNRIRKIGSSELQRIPKKEKEEILKYYSEYGIQLEILYVPRGSESVCTWCKKVSNCRFVKFVTEFATNIKVERKLHHLPIAFVTSCPINEFEARECKNYEIKQRYARDRLKIMYIVDK